MGTAGALLQAAGGKALPPTPHTLLQREEQMQIHTHMHTLPKQKKKKRIGKEVSKQLNINEITQELAEVQEVAKTDHVTIPEDIFIYMNFIFHTHTHSATQNYFK